MPTLTTNFELPKPDIGGDDDDWGGYLNAALDIIDAKLKALEIPVNGLYLSTSATNPGTSLGYGIWAPYAAGRALVGVGDNGEATWAAAEERGSETHTLTQAQLPSHTHGSGTLSAASGGAHTHPVSGVTDAAGLTGSFDISPANLSPADHIRNASGVFSESTSPSTARKLENSTSNDNMDRISFSGTHGHNVFATASSDGAHTHSITGSTASVGSGTEHNNVQPSIGVYVWRRTS